MLLYSESAMADLGDLSEDQMETELTAAISSTNEAFADSDIPLQFSLVHVQKVKTVARCALGVTTLL